MTHKEKPKGRLFITDGEMVLDKDNGISVGGKDMSELISIQLGENWRLGRIDLGQVRIWIQRL